ncbi:hypothetical protein M378DRAFT_738562 [Amanita muscaria Koide BX008]|uniref:Uncharacterized protein n=1 Tax=Amanita muscaria (strain Koide BX008) TaxID=946122 RepID=A0A0C2X160_AMAMK|nr:hypothetical protein M378DRAFT_738562 [Amanita muscaria Koide BX008]
MLATQFLRALPFALFFSSIVGATPTPSPRPTLVTAQRIYHEIVDVFPYIIDRTEVLAWTATPDPTPSNSA